MAIIKELLGNKIIIATPISVATGIVSDQIFPNVSSLTFQGRGQIEKHPSVPNVIGFTGEDGSSRTATYWYPDHWEISNNVPYPLKGFATPYGEDTLNYIDWGLYYTKKDAYGYNPFSLDLNLKTNGYWLGNFPSFRFTWQDTEGVYPYGLGIIHANLSSPLKCVRAFEGDAITGGQYISNSWKIYQASNSGTMGDSRPTHSSGSATIDGITWTFVRDTTADWVAGDFRPFVCLSDRDELPDLTAAQLREIRCFIDRDLTFEWSAGISFLNSTNDDIEATLTSTTNGIILERGSSSIRISSSGTKNFFQLPDTTFIHSTRIESGTGATPDASNTSLIRLQPTAATNITAFSNLIAWQEFTVYFANGNSTLVHSASLSLKSGANETPAAQTAKRFLAISSGSVVEV